MTHGNPSWSYLNRCNCRRFLRFPYLFHDVDAWIKVIKPLPPGKAVGPCGWSNDELKLLPNICISDRAWIFQIIAHTGYHSLSTTQDRLRYWAAYIVCSAGLFSDTRLPFGKSICHFQFQVVCPAEVLRSLRQIEDEDDMWQKPAGRLFAWPHEGLIQHLWKVCG